MGIELLIGTVLGGLVSWAITHVYYRQSSAKVPAWAKPLVEKLSDTPPSLEGLIKLYHEALEAGEFHPDPLTGYVVCPRCGTPSSEFKYWEANDPERGDLYRGVRCPHCNWEQGGEV